MNSNQLAIYSNPIFKESLSFIVWTIDKILVDF